MFIELTAAYRNEEQPDFENMGIKVTGSDMADCVWDSLWIDYQSIVTMFVNSDGLTNVDLLNGERWTVKESPEEISKLCKIQRSLRNTNTFKNNQKQQTEKL